MYSEQPITDDHVKMVSIQETMAGFMAKTLTKNNLTNEERSIVTDMDIFIKENVDEEYGLISCGDDNELHKIYDYIHKKKIHKREIESMTNARIIEKSVRAMFPNGTISVLGNVIKGYIESSEGKPLDFNFSKILAEITVNEILGEKYEDDIVIDSLDTFDEKIKEVVKRFYQIEAANNGSLTYQDIIEILGSVKLKYLQQAYNIVASTSKFTTKTKVNSKGKWRR